MNRTALTIGSLAALAVLSACGGSYGYHSAGFAEPDVWYDGAYGPYVDGYWGGDGFYYRSGEGRFIHDDGGHFRHERFEHANGFHSSRHDN